MLDIEHLVRELTLEEKAGLCSGADQWHTKTVERLGIPAIRLSDGPHGMRVLDEKRNAAKAVCYPTGSALAASFDVDLAEEIGRALGDAAKSLGVHTVLGPAVNMKRSPLCGRNFEYLSEDPYVAGEIGAALTAGIQKRGVGACPKHFAANNQETRRMSVSAQVDEQALREVYLPAFERIVKKANPHTMMCAYNRVNGVYSCENKWLLTDVLREEWGYQGIVMTDWAAMNERPRALEAGLELEMPSSYGENDQRIVKAVKEGSLSMKVLDQAVRRLLVWIDKELEGARGAGQAAETGRAAALVSEQGGRVETTAALDLAGQDELARRAAGECAVLLKNDGILPLTREKKIAVIGGFAKKPRFEGGGSSHVNVEEARGAWEYMKALPGITYAEGFHTADDVTDEALIAEAVETARGAEAAVIFAGLPDSFESEGHDRSTLSIPESQNRLIDAVCTVQPRTVVVFHGGSPVVLPWRDKVSAILYMYLGGQNVGAASVDLLFGDVNPSGKLAETFPLRLEDTPCFLDFPGSGAETQYSEGVYIGYRWYEKRAIPVEYPFGHGLSYTAFSYSNMQTSREHMQDTDQLSVSVDVKNVGSRAGKEIVQLYVAPVGERRQMRPVKELKGFQKIFLEPGETRTVTFELDKRSFAYYNKELGDWYVESGEFDLLAGSSSVNILQSATVKVEGTAKLPIRYSEYLTVGDLWESGLHIDEVMKLMDTQQLDLGAVGLTPEEMERAAHIEEVKRGMPIHAVVSSGKRDMGQVYDALRRIEGLEGKERIPRL